MNKTTFDKVKEGQHFVAGGDVWLKHALMGHVSRRGYSNACRAFEDVKLWPKEHSAHLSDDLDVIALDGTEDKEDVLDFVALTTGWRENARKRHLPMWHGMSFAQIRARKFEAMKRWNLS